MKNNLASSLLYDYERQGGGFEVCFFLICLAKQKNSI